MTDVEGTVSDINTLYQNDTDFSGITSMDATITQADNFTENDFNHINNGDIDTLKFANADDTISFTDETSFDTWADKFNDVDFGSGNNDSISFDNGVNGELILVM